MEIKKHPKADLEKLRGIFLQVGFVLTLGFVLVAFEWSNEAGDAGILVGTGDLDMEEEIMEITRRKEKAEPPKPKVMVIETLIITENEAEIDDDELDFNSEADPDTEYEIMDMDEEVGEEEIFVIVEQQPLFPGGISGLMKHISKNIKYPNIARENNITGKVYVRFVVKSTGDVANVSISRSVDPVLDKEALRVVKKLPRWKPGKQRGKAVSVWYSVPINFQLQ